MSARPRKGRAILCEPVLTAKIGVLRRAARLLRQQGIECRHSSPKRGEGILSVARADGPRARIALSRSALGTILGEVQARHFYCHACDAPLPLGARRCPSCGAFTGDPHAG